MYVRDVLLICFFLSYVCHLFSAILYFAFVSTFGAFSCVIRGCVPKKILVYGATYGGELEVRSIFFFLNHHFIAFLLAVRAKFLISHFHKHYLHYCVAVPKLSFRIYIVW